MASTRGVVVVGERRFRPAPGRVPGPPGAWRRAGGCGRAGGRGGDGRLVGDPGRAGLGAGRPGAWAGTRKRAWAATAWRGWVAAGDSSSGWWRLGSSGWSAAALGRKLQSGERQKGVAALAAAASAAGAQRRQQLAWLAMALFAWHSSSGCAWAGGQAAGRAGEAMRRRKEKLREPGLAAAAGDWSGWRRGRAGGQGRGGVDWVGKNVVGGWVVVGAMRYGACDMGDDR